MRMLAHVRGLCFTRGRSGPWQELIIIVVNEATRGIMVILSKYFVLNAREGYCFRSISITHFFFHEKKYDVIFTQDVPQFDQNCLSVNSAF